MNEDKVGEGRESLTTCQVVEAHISIPPAIVRGARCDGESEVGGE